MASFMDMALDQARAAGERGEVPIGCVIVRDGAVLARAGNSPIAGRDPTAHAEILAIREAAGALGSERLDGCDLYVTLEPCAMCAGAISFARIRRLYYGAADPKGGAVDNGVKFFASPTCHHRPEVFMADWRRPRLACAMLRKRVFSRAPLGQQCTEPLLDLGFDRLGGPQDRSRLIEVERAGNRQRIRPDQEIGRGVVELGRR